ncbi:glycosyltransferase family 9 protein [uncultured Dokdonia sp.]|uniref:glycosyltransferase family 9 protein n=1 Tax=uncultured Dokdonia sp. TaxID=575653 RepID=UPI002609E9FE|nr:glycosyltransferase family 9 protein [uncultured Dokdonia sp.]
MDQKILIIQHKMIGDVLTSSILCEAIKYKYPNAIVHYLINEHTLPVLENNPYIDQKVVFTPEMVKSRKAAKQFRSQLAPHAYDIVIDVYSKIGSARITKATKAKQRIGYKKWYTKTFYTNLYTYHYIPETEAGLAIENRMKLLQAIATDFPKALKPKLYVTEEEIAFAKAKLAGVKTSSEQKLYMIGILGSSQNKTYPLPYLATLLDHIVATTQAQLLFNYIPKQIDQVETLYQLCSEKTQQHIQKDIYGKSLREFIALTTQCDALIGNEGGAINMAKAIDIPTFAIFSPWIRRAAWALYENDHNHVVHLQDYEAALYTSKSLKDIKKRHEHYYSLLKPEMILEKLDEFIAIT